MSQLMTAGGGDSAGGQWKSAAAPSAHFPTFQPSRPLADKLPSRETSQVRIIEENSGVGQVDTNAQGSPGLTLTSLCLL